MFIAHGLRKTKTRKSENAAFTLAGDRWMATQIYKYLAPNGAETPARDRSYF
jgi:hypothetical protein